MITLSPLPSELAEETYSPVIGRGTIEIQQHRRELRLLETEVEVEIERVVIVETPVEIWGVVGVKD